MDEDTVGLKWVEMRRKFLHLAKLECKPAMADLLELADKDIPDGKIIA